MINEYAEELDKLLNPVTLIERRDEFVPENCTEKAVTELKFLRKGKRFFKRMG